MTIYFLVNSNQQLILPLQYQSHKIKNINLGGYNFLNSSGFFLKIMYNVSEAVTLFWADEAIEAKQFDRRGLSRQPEQGRVSAVPIFMY